MGHHQRQCAADSYTRDVLNGLLPVKDKDLNLNMAPIGANFSDAVLTAVLTCIRSSWGNKAGDVTADEVKKSAPQLARTLSC